MTRYIPPHLRNKVQEVKLVESASEKTDIREENINDNNDKGKKYVAPHLRNAEEKKSELPTVNKSNIFKANQSKSKSNLNFWNQNIESDKNNEKLENDILDRMKNIKLSDTDLQSHDHIIEISDFTNKLKTIEIERTFSKYSQSGFGLKWINDDHCFIIFPDSETVDRAIVDEDLIPVFKMKTINNISVFGKNVILSSPGSWSKPFKKRPKVSMNAAQRMINHSLGIANIKK